MKLNRTYILRRFSITAKDLTDDFLIPSATHQNWLSTILQFHWHNLWFHSSYLHKEPPEAFGTKPISAYWKRTHLLHSVFYLYASYVPAIPLCPVSWECWLWFLCLCCELENSHLPNNNTFPFIFSGLLFTWISSPVQLSMQPQRHLEVAASGSEEQKMTAPAAGFSN